MRYQNRPRSEKPFLQYSVRQFFALIVIVGLLLAIVAPRIRKALDDRGTQVDFLRKREIQATLDAAVRAGDLHHVQDSLEAGADPNVTLGGRQELLCMSIENGHEEIVEALLDYGADVEKCSALATAIDCTHLGNARMKMIRLLLQHGADPHREHYGNNAMDLAVRHGDARLGDLLREHGLEYGPREMAAFNRLEELRLAVEKDPSIVKQRFGSDPRAHLVDHPTLLGIALAGGHQEMASYLIDHGAALDVREGAGATLLHRAARGGNPDLIRLLLSRGLDVNSRDDYGDTPLIESVQGAPLEAVDVLIGAGADLNSQGINEETALHRAVCTGRARLVATLLSAGADQAITNTFGQTPLDLVRKQIATLEDRMKSPLCSAAERQELEFQVKERCEIEELLSGELSH